MSLRRLKESMNNISRDVFAMSIAAVVGFLFFLLFIVTRPTTWLIVISLILIKYFVFN